MDAKLISNSVTFTVDSHPDITAFANEMAARDQIRPTTALALWIRRQPGFPGAGDSGDGYAEPTAARLAGVAECEVAGDDAQEKCSTGSGKNGG